MTREKVGLRTLGSEPTIDCPWNCPCQRPKVGFRSQQQPSRSIEEVIEARGFARKNDDGRSADRRLANPSPSATSPRRVFLSIRQRAGYATRDLVLIVP